MNNFYKAANIIDYAKAQRGTFGRKNGNYFTSIDKYKGQSGNKFQIAKSNYVLSK